ncbi:MAG: hypothetical protein DCF30_14370 [Hyphomicrobiales bacterium]|nr:MAG: hypothetical protein DCF30_14370 [Hyphomicrobiales bacterium]
MRIFVSYAAEDRPVAESVVHSLRARGHDVFFDRDSLPPGHSYEDQIAASIQAADLLVYLVSPHSVSPKSFTLTELGLAERKWASPARRVLPVMVESTDYGSIPAYLKAVTVLEPRGNVAAETAAAVSAMRRIPARLLKYGGVVAIALIMAGIGYRGYLASVGLQLKLTAPEPAPWERGYFGAPSRFRHGLTVLNNSTAGARLSQAQLVSKPEGALRITDRFGLFAKEAIPVLAPGSSAEGAIVVEPVSTTAGEVSWQLCVTEASGSETCSPAQAWRPKGDFSPATAFTLDPDLSQHAVAVARDNVGFLLLRRSPAAVLRLDETGQIIANRALIGDPTTLYADETGIYVGTRGPNAIIKLDPERLDLIAEVPVRFPSKKLGAFGNPVSSTPAVIARGGDRLWIVTRGGASGAGLLHMSTALTDPQVPDFFDDIAYNTKGMMLSTNGRDVWATETNATPASLRKLSPDKLATYSGHEFDIASCATGILVEAESLLIPDCNGTVQRVVEKGKDLQIQHRVDALLGYAKAPSIWTTVQMRPGPGDGGGFLVNTERTAGSPATESIVNRLNTKRGLKMPLDIKNIRIVDLAFQDKVFMVIIEGAGGQRETLALRYE